MDLNVKQAPSLDIAKKSKLWWNRLCYFFTFKYIPESARIEKGRRVLLK